MSIGDILAQAAVRRRSASGEDGTEAAVHHRRPADEEPEMTPADGPVRRLCLVRHGRTALNAQGRLRGRSDPPLDEVGLAEAERLGAALAGVGAEVVASSPLERAWRTAHVIARAASLPHVVDDRLADREYGTQTGRVQAEVEARWGGLDLAPGVEPAADLLRRARAALDELLDAHGAAVAVSHDAVIRAVIASIDPGLRLAAPTGSWNRLERRDGTWRVVEADLTP